MEENGMSQAQSFTFDVQERGWEDEGIGTTLKFVLAGYEPVSIEGATITFADGSVVVVMTDETKKNFSFQIKEENWISRESRPVPSA